MRGRSWLVLFVPGRVFDVAFGVPFVPGVPHEAPHDLAPSHPAP